MNHDSQGSVVMIYPTKTGLHPEKSAWKLLRALAQSHDQHLHQQNEDMYWGYNLTFNSSPKARILLENHGPKPVSITFSGSIMLNPETAG